MVCLKAKMSFELSRNENTIFRKNTNHVGTCLEAGEVLSCPNSGDSFLPWCKSHVCVEAFMNV